MTATWHALVDASGRSGAAGWGAFLCAGFMACVLGWPLVAAADPATSQPDSARMSRDLQQMPWVKFRRVVEAIPKLKSGIDLYGPFGWQVVKDNYRTYNWKKRIDRLAPSQQQQLGELIETAKASR